VKEVTRRKPKNQKYRSTAVEWTFNTFEWLIIAFALTLIFIVFEMQAYTIPTGSMADTLKGAHFRLRCPQCGYRYDYDFLPQYYRMPRNTTPSMDVPIMPREPRCPSCGYYHPIGHRVSANGSLIRDNKTVVKGDRIFVLKCIYQFIDPKLWDVVVFKNPLNPSENYIKRMIAGPGQTVEIIDGNVYIDGFIARKPPKVQEELWMCVYDNDYQPARPEIKGFNEHVWRQPFRNLRGSQWNLEETNGIVFSLESPTDQINTIVYDTNIGNDFRATYAYDDRKYYPAMPICSDLMVRFHISSDSKGVIGAGLSKYGIDYKGWVDFSGHMIIEKTIGQESSELNRLMINPVDFKEPVQFKFANIDHELILEFGDDKLIYDLGRVRDGIVQERIDVMPEVSIFGTGQLLLSHIGLFRDIHYITSRGNNGGGILRAGENNAFELGEDEFFVLGDNSPHSLDCRLWEKAGIGNNGHQYREGTVPRDYLVGKAFFIYWPGPMRPFSQWPRIIPYIGGIKTIYGGNY
jgi:signal peptidase I